MREKIDTIEKNNIDKIDTEIGYFLKKVKAECDREVEEQRRIINELKEEMLKLNIKVQAFEENYTKEFENVQNKIGKLF